MKMRNEVTTDLTEIKRIVSEHYEQIFANKLTQMEEKFLDRHKLLKST